MYGLICVALVVLRREDPDWYDPSFRMPGSPVLPVVGAIASFARIAFMAPASIVVGAVVMAISYGWYRHYAGSVDLRGDL